MNFYLQIQENIGKFSHEFSLISTLFIKITLRMATVSAPFQRTPVALLGPGISAITMTSHPNVNRGGPLSIYYRSDNFGFDGRPVAAVFLEVSKR